MLAITQYINDYQDELSVHGYFAIVSVSMQVSFILQRCISVWDPTYTDAACTLEHVRSDALKVKAPMTNEIIQLVRVRRVEMLPGPSAVSSEERLHAVALLAVHVPCDALVGVSQVYNGVVSLHFVGGVEVVRCADRVEAVEGDGVGRLVRENAARGTFRPVPEVVDGVLVFIVIGRVEVVRCRGVVGVPKLGDEICFLGGG